MLHSYHKLCFLLLALATPTVYIAVGQQRPPITARVQLTMPNVIGKTQEQAQQILGTVIKVYGLKISVVEMPTPNINQRVVRRQLPAADSPLSQQGTITLYVAVPTAQPQPATYTTPNLVGQDMQTATQNIFVRRYQFQLQPQEVFAPNVSPGIIVRQRPSAGTAISFGTAIFVEISAPTTTVPSIIGKKYTDAQNILRAKGLQLVLRQRIPQNVEPETILTQLPAPQTIVRLKSNVAVTVSTVELVVVPFLRSLSVEIAKNNLNNLRLAPVITEEINNSLSPGTVITQTPQGGTRVLVGTQVRLSVAKLQVINVPNVIGKSSAEAAQILAQSQLKSAPKSQATNQRPANTVIQQNPTAGTAVTFGQSIALTIATPDLVTVPNVKGKPVSEAFALLHKNRLRTEPPANTNAIVQNQSPPAGQRVPANMVVTLVTIVPATPPPASPQSSASSSLPPSVTPPVSPLPRNASPASSSNPSNEAGGAGIAQSRNYSDYLKPFIGFFAVAGFLLIARGAIRFIKHFVKKPLPPSPIITVRPNFRLIARKGTFRFTPLTPFNRHLSLELTPNVDAGKQTLIKDSHLVDKERMQNG